MILIIIMNIILVTIDQVTKYFAAKFLMPVDTVSIIDGVFSLTYAENRGAAFGLLQGGRWFFVITTMVVLIGVYVYYSRLPKSTVYNWLRAALILISSGAIGNFLDRFRQGYVVDFFHATFINFPIFNVADSFLVVGTILLAIIVFFFIKDDEK